ncbi:MAG: glycosyltransferase [Pseudomonadota bacterium]
MNKASILTAVAIAVLTFLLWALVNRPTQEPPWPTRIDGFSFSPFQVKQDPEKGRFPSIEQIDRDLALLQDKVHAVRTYTVEGAMGEIPRLAAARGLNVTLGAWINRDQASNDEQIERLITVFRENHRNVVRVLVGNEVLLRKEMAPKQLIALVKRVKKKVWAPVSVAEPWHIWLKNPGLADAVDFITVHLLPYWEGVEADEAIDYALRRLREVEQAFPDKPVIIGEIGWPSRGRVRKEAEPSTVNQARFLRRFLARAQREDLVYYVMEAFDQPWKRSIEGSPGASWGIYNAEREPKFAFTEPLVSVPEWQELAALSIVAAVVVLLLLFRDSSTLDTRGRGFLALVAYGTATAAVWLIYDYSNQYMTLGSLIVGILLLVAGLGVVLVLLAEAHEWAEALWLRNWRRPFVRRTVAEDDLPFVSVHVPAYNEPPDMMIETLEALAGLDYQKFEVIVVDNNTKDPSVWQPVRDRCAALGSRFHFIHADPLDGFKAGALNLALRHTAEEASVIAVIDSDYQVDPNWLRHLAPAFLDPKVGIVQGPQDYRDGDENAFKAMCQAEYRGFFHIGMLTRNERNAIIQHGTMTMVDRALLDELNGWAEWCITEDAELGLRVFEAGYDALYIPHSYGRGLMPDTFVDFKKQRFRWAYGAVIVMRHHLRELIGLRRTRLTAGQRYHFVAGWLPWFADGFNLLFNLAALAWSLGMVLRPQHFEPPLMALAALPLSLFVFKLAKILFLYRLRVAATLRQSFAASLAGLALSHTIARAIMTGLFTRKIGFYRTPKMANAPALFRALMDAREELLFLVALLLAAGGVIAIHGTDMPDVLLWVTVLLVQSISYLAAILVSLLSSMPWLPARLVGPMGEIRLADPVDTG